MKTLLIFFTAVFCGATSNAQNLKITFKGSGASTTVSTVQIENITRGTSLTVGGKDTLQLTSLTAIGTSRMDNSSALTIYPNPTIENFFLEFTPPVAGNAVISISDLTGRLIAIYRDHLVNTRQKFVLSCIGNGTYLISVSGRNFHLAGQLISLGNYSGTPFISKINDPAASPADIPEAVFRKNEDDPNTLAFSPGEILKFTATSGKFSTVVVDSPLEDKTVQFEFVACNDGDNNNYPVVKIGDQIWMAENLKTTKYRDGSSIPYNTNDTLIGARGDLGYPGYSWYNDDSTYRDTYGGLYTLETLRTKKLCPVGWHAMVHSEIDTLISYLGGGSTAGGKLKENGTAHWKSPNAGATNESGFTAVPGGIRHENGTFQGIGEYATYMSVNVCDGSATDGCMYTLHFENGVISGDEHAGTYGTSVRCIYGGGPQIVSTWIDTSSVDLTSATAGGEIDRLETVTERGLCWSENFYPTINDSFVMAGSGAGRFSGRITGLDPGSLYWVRAYARNETGITYGAPVQFTTSVMDIDGNVYRTVAINQVFEGRQIWMASNLRTTGMNDHTTITELKTAEGWSDATAPAYCSYDNQKNEDFGFLYNWFAVVTGKLCPEGWGIADTTQYKVNVGPGHNLDLQVLAPGGRRDSNGEFKEKGEAGYFWFNTGDENGPNAWSWSFKTGKDEVKVSAYSKKSGFSVRCFRKTTP